MGLTTGPQEIIGNKTFTGKTKFKGKVEFKRENWTEVTAFQNSWVNYNSSTTTTAAYVKDSFGFVHLKGTVKDGTVGDVACFTLPIGYRISKIARFPIVSNSLFGIVRIETDGAVKIVLGSNAYACLDGITFYVG